MHILIQDVRTASAQKLRVDVQSAIALTVEALGDARKAEDERLRYQRQVLENLRLLETINQELSTAKIELASLINAPLTQELQVVEPAEAPDLREQFYNTRIANEETTRTWITLAALVGVPKTKVEAETT
jgi:hypothetical protein